MTEIVIIGMGLALLAGTYWGGAHTGYASGYRDGKDIGYRRGKYDTERRLIAEQGCRVEGRVTKGKDGRFGLEVGAAPTAFRPKFDADLITTGGDRKRDRALVAAKFRRYWPTARLLDEAGKEIGSR